MTKKTFSILIIVLLLGMPVCANSSWYWISQTRPYDLLPLVVAVTLITETAGIILIAKTSVVKTLITVISANLLSFLTPYAAAWGSWYGRAVGFFNLLERSPFYTVNVDYLGMTLIIEVPIVYFMLNTKCVGKKRLLAVIVIANVLTTAFTCLLETKLCWGAW